MLAMSFENQRKHNYISYFLDILSAKSGCELPANNLMEFGEAVILSQ